MVVSLPTAASRSTAVADTAASSASGESERINVQLSSRSER
jgi:hypothetical protein